MQAISLYQPINISKREQEVLELIFQEQTTKQIASTLYISKSTVETHRANLLIKFDCGSSIGLIKRAIRRGYVSL